MAALEYTKVDPYKVSVVGGIGVIFVWPSGNLQTIHVAATSTGFAARLVTVPSSLLHQKIEINRSVLWRDGD
jgi:hypothetical protein